MALYPTFESGFARSASQSRAPNLWDGLLVAYAPPLGYQGATVYDLSGYGRHGVFTVLTEASYVDARQYSPAIQTNGSSSYWSVSPVPAIANNPFTVVVQWMLNSTTGTSALFWLGAESTRAGLHIRRTSTTAMLFGLYNDDLAISGLTTMTTGEWYLTHATMSGANLMTFYHQGIARGTLAAGGPFVGTTECWVAHDREPFWFNGWIAQVRVYNRELTAQEIIQDYLDPFAWLTLRPRQYASSVIDVGGSIVPAAMYQYRRRRVA